VTEGPSSAHAHALMEPRRTVAVTVLLILAAIPVTARADRRELYVLVTVEPQLGWYTEPLAGHVSATQPGVGAALSAYYGLTHRLHVGADLHLSAARDVSFPSATVSLSDGTPSTGTVYANPTSIGANALFVYRHDTGYNLAPMARVEIGFASVNYTNIQQTPTGPSYFFSFPDSSELVLELRGALLAEYRITNHFVASAGLAVTGHPKGRAPWSVSLPLTAGWVW
jgi:hypothetical protein